MHTTEKDAAKQGFRECVPEFRGGGGSNNNILG